MVVTTVKGFTFIEIRDEALQVYWNHTTAKNSLCKVSSKLNSFLTSSFQHLGYNARRASSLRHFFILLSALWIWVVDSRQLVLVLALVLVLGGGGGGGGGGVLMELIAWPWPFKLNSTSRSLAQCSTHALEPASCTREEAKPKALPAFHLGWLLAPPFSGSELNFMNEQVWMKIWWYMKQFFFIILPRFNHCLSLF